MSLMVAELTTLLPEEGGYYVWVREAMGRFWAVQEGVWTIRAGLACHVSRSVRQLPRLLLSGSRSNVGRLFSIFALASRVPCDRNRHGGEPARITRSGNVRKVWRNHCLGRVRGACGRLDLVGTQHWRYIRSHSPGLACSPTRRVVARNLLRGLQPFRMGQLFNVRRRSRSTATQLSSRDWNCPGGFRDCLS